PAHGLRQRYVLRRRNVQRREHTRLRLGDGEELGGATARSFGRPCRCVCVLHHGLLVFGLLVLVFLSWSSGSGLLVPGGGAGGQAERRRSLRAIFSTARNLSV